jgi:hypothetical protein
MRNQYRAWARYMTQGMAEASAAAPRAPAQALADAPSLSQAAS